MAYGTLKADVIQSDTAGTPPQFNDGNSTQIGTLCRAWVNFNGTGTVAIRGSFNVSSITDNGTGDYTVNFTTALADANYACVMTVGAFSDVNDTNRAIVDRNHQTTSIRAMTFVCSTGALADMASVNVSVFR